MPVYAVDALPYIRSMLGHGYYAGGCRCEVSCNTQDCSGFIVAGTRSAGLYIPCISSAGFAIWGRTAGTLISETEAVNTPLAVGIKGPNGGEAGNGPLGHIVWMVGDGQHTYEAMGTRYGIVVGQAFGRGFVRWMKIPGLTYGPKPPVWKVKPMYDPALPVRARLQHPEGGWWDAHDDGRVDFLPIVKGAGVIEGGLTTAADRLKANGKHVAKLEARDYTHNGATRHGYQIVFTDGTTAVPEAQHNT